MTTENHDSNDLTLHTTDTSLPATNIDLDRLEQDSSQLKQKTAVYLEKVTDHYKTILQQKRNNIDALLETIKTKREALSKKKEDSDHYESVFREIQVLEQQNEALETQLDALRKKQSLGEQMAVNSQRISAELKQKRAVLARKTGLVVHNLEDNYLKFDFTLIDQHEPDKLFSFVIHLSKEGSYKVVECDPMLPNLDVLTKDLNRHGLFSSFIKQMRREFCHLASFTSPETAQRPTSPESSTLLSPQRPLTDTTTPVSPVQQASPPKTPQQQAPPHQESSDQ